MGPNPQDTEEIVNGKPHFLCSADYAASCKKNKTIFFIPWTYYSISKDGEDMKAGFHLQKFLVDFGNPSSKLQGNLSHL